VFIVRGFHIAECAHVAEHHFIDPVLPAFRPLRVVLPNDFQRVPQDVRDFFKRCAPGKQPSGKGVSDSVGTGIVDAGFLEDRRHGSLSDADNSTLGRDPVPEIERTILGGAARGW